MRYLVAVALLGLAFGTAPRATAQNISDEPTYGDVHLSGGFLPDPHLVELTAGGSVAVDVDGCSYGHVANAPDIDLYYKGNGSRTLYIWAVSDQDITLLINTPGARWRCDDDSYGSRNPILVFPNVPSGLYNIWVGTYGDQMAPARLYISEIDLR